MTKIGKYLTLLYQRFLSKTPIFFKKLIIFGLFLTGIGSTVTEFGDGLPTTIQKAGKYCAVAGATISLVAKFTTEDEHLTQKSEDLLKKG